MNIPVLLEPTPTGFRASTGAPLHLTVEAPTADAALAGLRREFVVKQIAGMRVVELAIPAPDPLIELTRKMADNPFLDEWTAATKAYRAECEAAEAARDVTEEATAPATNPAPSATREPAA